MQLNEKIHKNHWYRTFKLSIISKLVHNLSTLPNYEQKKKDKGEIFKIIGRGNMLTRRFQIMLAKVKIKKPATIALIVTELMLMTITVTKDNF